MDNTALRQLAQQHPSFYLYDQAAIVSAIATLKTNFPTVDFLYSAKTNPHDKVVETIATQGFGIDAASVAEVMLGVQNGVPKEKIQFSAPGKTMENLADTVDHAIIIADSFHELDQLHQLAQERNTVLNIGIRINPNFGFDGGASCSKFGIDQDQLFAQLPTLLQQEHLNIVGLHCHLRSQSLDVDLLHQYHKNLLALALEFQTALGHPLQFLNMGSGIGIPYGTTDTEVDVAALGAVTTAALTALQSALPQTKFYIETGRYVVGKAGVYVTRVLDKKVSHGTTMIILCNTLNGFIRPSIEQMVTGYTTQDSPHNSEPLFTSKGAFQFTALTDSITFETVTLMGNLCTAMDVMAKNLTLPTLEIGDSVMVNNAGSYAAVLSPVQFSSQQKPVELFLTSHGQILTPFH
ncbi:alanine racemase [Bengtsoniella intestinalis]|uniref:hypothetical protein n=1 Tax=Bengtsoniella intestinalis TaxID=3073143 RepID=UPI00391F124D